MDVSPKLLNLKTKLFADSCNLQLIESLLDKNLIAGVTTNPSIMRQAGIKDYPQFARQLLSIVRPFPVSLEVISDDFATMKEQARLIASWGENAVIKIPIVNSKGESCLALIENLLNEGLFINITATMTMRQVDDLVKLFHQDSKAYVSMFAGRIADTGVCPKKALKEGITRLDAFADVNVIWASAREVFNVFDANAIGCDIITLNDPLLKKLPLVGRDLEQYSLETVKMFIDDALAARYFL